MVGAHRLRCTPSRLIETCQRMNAYQRRNLHHQWAPQHPLRPRNPRQPKASKTLSLATPIRLQSTAASSATSAGSRIVAYVYGTGLVLLLGFGYLYITDTRASVHQWLLVPALRLLYHDPEEAHHAGIRYIKGLHDFNLHPRERGSHDQDVGDLKIEVFGHVLDNPIGTSAGIDKNAEIPSALMALGPAVVEVGGATPFPQVGNDKPRVFRIPSQNALINRYGLNSEGAEHVAMQLRERLRQFTFDHGLGLDAESERIVLDGNADVPPGSLVPGKLLAVQIAKNKTTPDSDINAVVRDYVFCVEHLAKYADILVVNVSSPNTPGLRDLQATAPLTAILSSVVSAAKSCDRRTSPAVMVKVSPDEDSDAQIEGICAAVWASGVDGVIVGNTTKKRPNPAATPYVMPAGEAQVLAETGGYSGPQMFERTLSLVGRYRQKLDQGPPNEKRRDSVSTPSQPPSASSELEHDPVEASIERDLQRLKPQTPEADKDSKQPLVQLPDRHTGTVEGDKSGGQTKERPGANSGNPPPDSSTESKVIFATGGITNGEQCLQILNAGASVCQIYTAMMYGGVGTVTRMKAEMRQALRYANTSSN